uniref:Secreted protein n=1 Tax=Macrostomum lignano TaxID=282301 RepID=A0A1I8FBL4_9PLAT
LPPPAQAGGFTPSAPTALLLPGLETVGDRRSAAAGRLCQQTWTGASMWAVDESAASISASQRSAPRFQPDGTDWELVCRGVASVKRRRRPGLRRPAGGARPGAALRDVQPGVAVRTGWNRRPGGPVPVRLRSAAWLQAV